MRTFGSQARPTTVRTASSSIANPHLNIPRPVLAGALHEVLGPDAPVTSVLGPDYKLIPENGSRQLAALPGCRSMV